ncbi:TPA: hypothetical protein N0F65_009168 [Lagenidium giganteum]|uniref:FAD dependent oxidoreductase domain-containing protein n=1 Tax=Lagenidium giganteum TaxID=4803 RepID=A0AAV2YSK4_9STRA|nr:TPA: hypothetical protein N0F65_009168 [Lagenidium giganteum]
MAEQHADATHASTSASARASASASVSASDSNSGAGKAAPTLSTAPRRLRLDSLGSTSTSIASDKTTTSSSSSASLTAPTGLATPAPRASVPVADLPLHLRDLEVVSATKTTASVDAAIEKGRAPPLSTAANRKLPLLPEHVKMEPSVGGRPPSKRVIVCGAGIIGLTTCYYLAKQGHEVLCVEKESAVGTQVSYCNGAFLDPALYSSWADFGLLRRAKAARGGAPTTRATIYTQLEQSGLNQSTLEQSTVDTSNGPAAAAGELQSSQMSTASRATSGNSRSGCFAGKPVKIEFSALRDPHFWKWGFQFLMNCKRTRADEHSRTIRELGFYSMLKLRELQLQNRKEDLEMDQTAKGTIEVFRHTAEYDAVLASDRRRHLDELGMELTPLNHIEAKNLEPSLLPEVYEPGALLSSFGTNGDVHKMCQALYKLCSREGVMFRFNTDVQDILTDGKQVVALQTRRGSLIEGDEFVLALGNGTAPLAKRAGISLSIYPVKGYIISVPVNEGFKAPLYNIYAGGHALISPLGNMLRISGGVDFSKQRPANQSNQRRFDWLLSQAKMLFPEGYLNVDQMKTHTCWRPVTADDVPLIGRTRISNLYVNAGHGSKGWTMSFGAAALLADEITGVRPQLDISKFNPHRFGIFG